MVSDFWKSGIHGGKENGTDDGVTGARNGPKNGYQPWTFLTISLETTARSSWNTKTSWRHGTQSSVRSFSMLLGYSLHTG